MGGGKYVNENSIICGEENQEFRITTMVVWPTTEIIYSTE